MSNAFCYILLFFVVFSVRFSGYTQNNNHIYTENILISNIKNATYADSIKVERNIRQIVKKFHRQESYTIELEGIYQAALYFEKSNRRDKSLKLYELARLNALEFGDKQKAIKFRFLKLKYTNFIEPKSKIKSILSALQKGNVTIELKLFFNTFLGDLYQEEEMFDLSMSHYMIALKHAEETHSIKNQTEILCSIGKLEYYLYKDKSARKTMLKALKKAEHIHDTELIASIYSLCSQIEFQIGNSKKSIYYIKKALPYFREKGFPLELGKIYYHTCRSYGGIGKLDTVEIYLDSAVTQFKKVNNVSWMQYAYLSKCKLDIDRKNLVQLERDIADLEILLKKKYYDDIQVELYDFKTYFYESKKDFQQALFFQKKRELLNNKLSKRINNSQIGEIKNQADYENQIQKERYKKNLIALNSKKNDLQWKWGIVVILLFTLIGFLMVIILNVRRNRQKELRFSGDLIRSIDEERSRIARHFHDDIGQLLSFLKVRVDMHRNSKNDDSFNLSNEISNIVDRSRTICHELYPTTLNKNGVNQAIAELMETTRNTIQIYCAFDLDFDETHLTMEHQTHLYRIIQECVNNTIKHACASSIKLTILQKEKTIHVSFKDNGKGFTPNSKQDGLGSRILKERINTLGGNLNIRSGSYGTYIDFTFHYFEKTNTIKQKIP